MVDVSVIMPIYKVEDYLERSIMSILEQSHADLELILVDDGSPDSSGEICDKYEKLDQRVKVIHKQNAGSGYARNSGLDASSGKYIYFADPDDFVDKNTIKDNLEIIQMDGSNIVEFGFYEEYQTESGVDRKATHVPDLKGFLTQKEFRETFDTFHAFRPFSLWNKLYDRSFIETNQLRFTNQKVGQDALFLTELYKYLEKISFNNKPYYHYLERDESAVTKFREERTFYELKIAKKFDELISYWNLENEYTSLKLQHYWRVVFIELKYVNFPDCPYTFKEKKTRLKELIEQKELKPQLRQMGIKDLNNAFNRLLFLLVKYNQLGIALRLMNLRLRFK